MNTKGTNKLKMYKAVLSVCTSNAAVWNGVPAFVAVHDRFASKIGLLEQLSFAQGTGTVGVKKVKDKEREETANRAHKMASALRAMASETGNTALLEQLHFSHAELLYNASSSNALQLMGRVKDAAVQHVGELIDYGITQTHVDELIAHIGLLTTAFGSTRDAIVSRGKNTELIKETIREIDAMLKMNIDQLVAVLAPDHHEFALSYEKAREIVDLHGKKHKLGNDGEPAA